MPRTASQIAAIVQSRIGNRAGGRIGARNIDDAILDAINDGIMDIAKRENVQALRRRATITVTTSASVYAVPTTDEDSNTIRVNQIGRVRFVRDGDTIGYNLIRLSPRRQDSIAPVTNSSHVGHPRFYSVHNGEIELVPYPDVAGTLYLRVSIYPDRITINQQHPFGDEYDDVIEAFATSDIMASLQLTDDSNVWLNKYAVRLSVVMQNERNNPDWEPSLEPDSYRMNLAFPNQDPFVRRM